MKKIIWLALLLAGCAKPPQIAVTTQVLKMSAGAGRLTVTIKNVENRPTTPIALDISVRAPDGAMLRVIHPAPFVLNQQETREIVAPFASKALTLEPVLVIREAESGKALQPVSVRALPPTSPPQAPATNAPVTPPRPGK